MSKLFNLKWEDDARPSEDHLSKFADEYAELCEALEEPDDLIAHVILLTDDENGPSVAIYGIEGDKENLHALYSEETEWVELVEEELDEG